MEYPRSCGCRKGNLLRRKTVLISKNNSNRGSARPKSSNTRQLVRRKNKEDRNKIYKVNLFNKRPGLPNSLSIKLEFCDYINITSTAIGYNSYRVNGPYDPDVTGVGLQPVAYDQLIALYDRQLTRKSHFTVTATNNNSVPVTMVLYPSSSSSLVSTIEDAVAQPGAIWSTMGGSGGQNRSRLNMTVDPKEWLQVPSWTAELYSATSAVPSTQVYWHLMFDNFGSTTKDVYAEIRIVYDIEFLYVRNLAHSSLSKYILNDDGKHYQNPILDEVNKMNRQSIMTLKGSQQSGVCSNPEIEL